ncbi:MAG: transposase family protein [Chlamydiales bacterium]|nr:transposase family protein [Chlamydiales bacterium]
MQTEDLLLTTLEHQRENRTYFHINQSYNESESTAYNALKFN